MNVAPRCTFSMMSLQMALACGETMKMDFSRLRPAATRFVSSAVT